MEPSPSSTSSPTTAKAPILDPLPIRAVGEIEARESISLIRLAHALGSLRLPDWSRSALQAGVDHFAHHGCFGGGFAIHRSSTLKFAEIGAPCDHVDDDFELVAWNHGPAEARIVDGDKVEQFFFTFFHFVEEQKAGRLRHGFQNQDAGHNRIAGKMALKEMFVDGDVFDSDDMLFSFHFLDHVDEKKWIAVRKDGLNRVDVENHWWPLS